MKSLLWTQLFILIMLCHSCKDVDSPEWDQKAAEKGAEDSEQLPDGTH